MNRLHGTITALITPFCEDGSAVDYDSLTTLLERQIDAGVTGVLPLGTTGETPTLSPAEKQQVLRHTVSVVNGRIPVMVGTGSNSTEATIVATREAEELGADQVLIVSPYYNKPSQEGLFQHFKAAAEASSLPIIVYNVAPRTAVNITTDTLQRIAELPTVVAVKEASGDINQIGDVIRTIQNCSDTFAVLSGDDGITLPLMSLGGTGVISVASNIVPEEVVALTTLALKGDFAGARKQHHELSTLFSHLFVETNPVPSKHALARMGLCSATVRLPLVPLSNSSAAILEQTLAECALLK